MEGRAEVRARVLGPRGARDEAASVAEEAEITLLLRRKVVARLAASPVALEELALGHLALRGLLASRADVRDVRVRRWRDGFHVVVDARAGRRATPRRGAPTATRGELLAAMRLLHAASDMYRGGGGVHTSALAALRPEPRLVHVAADVGKVNTIDRLAGKALLAGTRPRGAPLLLTTGRITGAMAERGLALGCALLVSHSGPTARAVAVAQEARVSLVGYARGGRCTVYTSRARIRP
ncbi:MAG: formate dehydrogenase accessory sulfurtransferase FdhD [Halobacteriales archaeon]|nr:formate dehydrogenase accessory sulfurtransferase FdhD [Halobacteriales archaeon]